MTCPKWALNRTLFFFLPDNEEDADEDELEEAFDDSEDVLEGGGIISLMSSSRNIRIWLDADGTLLAAQ